MKPERITTLREPPVVGRRYMVPTVTYRWLTDGVAHAWPVFLPKQEDAEHLSFPWQHYHVDPRFLGAREMARAARYHAGRAHWPDTTVGAAEATAQAVPLNRRGDWPDEMLPHPDPVWRPKLCRRSAISYHHGDMQGIGKLREAFAGQQCRSSKSGWDCPHKRFPLGSIAAVNGVITCPLHGLRIAEATGLVLALDEVGAPLFNAGAEA